MVSVDALVGTDLRKSSLKQFLAAAVVQAGAGKGPEHAVLGRLERRAPKTHTSDLPKLSSQQTPCQNPTHS